MSFRYTSLWRRRAREILWINNQYRVKRRVDFRLGSSNAQVKSGLGEVQGSSSLWSFGPVEKMKIACEVPLDKELEALMGMDRQGKVPSVNMYKSLLKACSKRKALAQAKQVHALLAKHRLESTGLLGEYVVSTLIKCGGLQDAIQVFQRLTQRTALSWTAVIAGYATLGQSREALRMYKRMQQEGVQPNAYTFVNLLKACGSIADLEEGRRIHAEAVKNGCQNAMFVGNSLVNMYGKCGSSVDAQNVFDGLSQRDVVTWTVILAAYAEQGEAEKVLQMYRKMQEEGVNPDARTFVYVLQACGLLGEKEDAVDERSTKVKSLKLGKTIHAVAEKMGYDVDVFIGNTLVSMYGKCGSIVDAVHVFDWMPQRSVVSWNAMLAAYTYVGQAKNALLLYEHMLEQGVSPNQRSFVSVFQACGMFAEKEGDVTVNGHATRAQALQKGKAIHADTRRRGCHSYSFFGNTLVSMYAKCGSMSDAKHVFDGLYQRDVVSWNVMLAAYVEQGQGEEALQQYEQMLEEGASPNKRSFISVISACGVLARQEDADSMDGHYSNIEYLARGKTVHAEARRRGFDSDIFVGSTLVNMYGKCGAIKDSLHVFNGLSQHDVVAWNAMLSAYVDQGLAEKALQLYGQMQEEGVSRDVWAFVSTLQACCILAESEQDAIVDGRLTKVETLQSGRVIHADIWRKGYDSDVFIGSTLVAMYGKCGSIFDAQRVFEWLSRRDVVAWTTMLAAYVEQGQPEKALQLYSQMQQEGLNPDDMALQCILRACSKTGSLTALRQMHQSLVFTGDLLSPPLANALIHAYGRCASMEDARSVFDAVPQPDVVSWTALIAGYAREGNPEACLDIYEKMQLAGVKPNQVTFLSLLTACSHAGWVDKGVEYFESMSRDHGVTPEIDHYVSMVDLLGRAGCFTKVEDLLMTMPVQPNMAMWLCLLGVCRKHGKVQLGEQAFDCALRLQSNHPAIYTLMANMYADAGLLDRAKAVRQMGDEWKKPGESWIQHEEEVAVFLVGDHKRAQQKRLHDFLVKTNLIMEGIVQWSS